MRIEKRNPVKSCKIIFLSDNSYQIIDLNKFVPDIGEHYVGNKILINYKGVEELVKIKSFGPYFEDITTTEDDEVNNEAIADDRSSSSSDNETTVKPQINPRPRRTRTRKQKANLDKHEISKIPSIFDEEEERGDTGGNYKNGYESENILKKEILPNVSAEDLINSLNCKDTNEEKKRILLKYASLLETDNADKLTVTETENDAPEICEQSSPENLIQEPEISLAYTETTTNYAATSNTEKNSWEVVKINKSEKAKAIKRAKGKPEKLFKNYMEILLGLPELAKLSGKGTKKSPPVDKVLLLKVKGSVKKELGKSPVGKGTKPGSVGSLIQLFNEAANDARRKLAYRSGKYVNKKKEQT